MREKGPYPEFSGMFFPEFGLNAEIYSGFNPNAVQYGPEKLRIRTVFVQWNKGKFSEISGQKPMKNIEQKMKLSINDFVSKCD